MMVSFDKDDLVLSGIVRGQVKAMVVVLVTKDDDEFHILFTKLGRWWFSCFV